MPPKISHHAAAELELLTFDPADVVGLADIQSRLVAAGRPVTMGTVSSWRHRAKQPTTERPMPEPDGWLSGSIPWWSWTRTILPWLVETGRIESR